MIFKIKSLTTNLLPINSLMSCSSTQFSYCGISFVYSEFYCTFQIRKIKDKEKESNFHMYVNYIEFIQ